MSLRTTLALLALSVMSGAPASAATVWKLDSAHSSAQFTVSHLLISRVAGTIPIKSATITTDASGALLTVTGNLDPRGIDTHDGARDDDLRSANYFDVNTYPAMSFESTKIIAADAKHFTVAGTLTMHGQTNPVTLNVVLHASGNDGRIAFSADGTLDRTQWGMTANPAVVGKDIAIHLEIESLKQ